jgi:hypothetical protein
MKETTDRSTDFIASFDYMLELEIGPNAKKKQDVSWSGYGQSGVFKPPFLHQSIL